MALNSRIFTVSLFDNSDEELLSRAVRRVVVHSDTLKALKLATGDLVAVVNYNRSLDSSSPPFSIGIAWPTLETRQDTLEISRSLLLTARLDILEDNKALLIPCNGKIPTYLVSLKGCKEARRVRLHELSPPGTVVGNPKGKGQDWLSLLLKERLVDLRYITATQILEVTYESKPRRFTISSVSADDADYEGKPVGIWTVGWDTDVVLDVEADKPKSGMITMPHVESLSSTPAEDAYSTVGGLNAQITQIRDLIELPLTRPELFIHFGLTPPRGILLHGPPGTGKTHLARAIARATGAQVLIVNGPELSSAYHGETEARLRAVFDDARAKSPAIIVLDEVDALCPARDASAGADSSSEVSARVVATLLTLMDGFSIPSPSATSAPRVMVVATTNRPHALDPALRRPGRFDKELELGPPSAMQRKDILRVLLRQTPHAVSNEDIELIAAKAHGYVGADLAAVVREAGTRAIRRWLASAPLGTSLPDKDDGCEPQLQLEDLLTALPAVRASALRVLAGPSHDDSVSSSRISFANVGGLGDVIQKLRECVEWPLKHPEAFRRLGVRAPRGVLLYGPPGCSKTLLVRALAGESGVNFVGVKGPELLSKYVGDSERAVRELFRKARAAAPCIVFFDEIDALASARAGATTAAAEGVLISLLTELDGAVELGMGVTVVAATNRPEVIDAALMRPGRLDRILYVGPPDLKGREEILAIRTRGMSVEPGLNLQEIAELTEGCSGAEIVALCQEAALLTMKGDMNAPHVPRTAFVTAAKGVRKQITQEVLEAYSRWQKRSGVTSA